MDYVPDNIPDCMGRSVIALEKGLTILGYLTNEYSFNNRPMADLKTANDEAATWIWEYNRIITFIDIVQDYIFEVSQYVEKAKEIEDGICRQKAAQSNLKD